MSQDLNVNIQDLEKLINALDHFQATLTDRLKTIELNWQICDDSWKGNAKQKFEQDFTETLGTLRSSLQTGEDSLTWLKKFHQLVEEFEQY